MTNETCGICETNESIGTKADVESSYDNDGHEHTTRIEFPICGECESNYYDGSETYPGLLALAD